MKLFISYSGKDRTLIEELAADLALLIDGAQVWYDHALKRSGGQEWWDLILEQIRACEVFIYALSPQVLKSEPCRREYGYARALGKPTLPLMMADVEIRYLPVELQAAQLVDFRQRGREQRRSLKASIRNLPPAPGLPDPLPIPPPAPLDPVGILFDRITRLTNDVDQQRLLIVEIEDLHEEDGFRAFVPELLTRLIDRDDVLTVRNLKRAQELQARIAPPPPPTDLVQAAFARARAFNSKRNKEWTPFITTFRDLKITDMPFCLVPVGSFQMGSDDGHYDDEQPVHPQTIHEPYWIQQYPLTNAQWALGVRAGAVGEPQGDDALKWYKDRAMANAPVVGVTWFEVVKFAEWLGCRLPTEVEWEYAARGVESLRYPWGNGWNADIPVWDANSGGKPADVTTKPEGISWVGAGHLIGNVWEWCSSVYDQEAFPYPYKVNDGREDANRTDVLRVLRGGSWRYVNSYYLRAACRDRYDPNYWLYGFGVRCARSS